MDEDEIAAKIDGSEVRKKVEHNSNSTEDFDDFSFQNLKNLEAKNQEVLKLKREGQQPA